MSISIRFVHCRSQALLSTLKEGLGTRPLHMFRPIFVVNNAPVGGAWGWVGGRRREKNETRVDGGRRLLNPQYGGQEG
jgi:hypothetical protein